MIEARIKNPPMVNKLSLPAAVIIVMIMTIAAIEMRGIILSSHGVFL